MFLTACKGTKKIPYHSCTIYGRFYQNCGNGARWLPGASVKVHTCSRMPPIVLLEQAGDGLYVAALIEARLKDGVVSEIREAEELQGTELAVVAEAYF